MRTISFRVGRLAGIPISIDVSWLLFLLFVSALCATMFRSQPAWGIVMTVGIYASVILHEMAHVVVGARKGIETEEIHLSVFGGTAVMRSFGPPKDEWLIAIVGPLTSFATALALGATALVLAGGPAVMHLGREAFLASDAMRVYGVLVGLPPHGDMTKIYAITVIAAIAFWNGGFGIFNLLPIYPLDGGRIVHSVIMRRTGDRLRAIKTCAGLTLVLGGVMIALSAWQIVETRRPTGMLRIGISLFLITQALGSYRTVQRSSNESAKGEDGRAAEARTPSESE